MAGAIYFEAKGEPLSGQLAVAEVILNRAKSGRFPKAICSVVTQRGQFSFVRGGRIPDDRQQSRIVVPRSRSRGSRWPMPGTARPPTRVLPRPPGFAALEPGEGRGDRQSRLLSLIDAQV